MESNRISVLVDDQAVVREALRALIETEDDIVVAGEAGDCRSAVQMARELLPGVVVMDIAMPLLSDAARFVNVCPAVR